MAEDVGGEFGLTAEHVGDAQRDRARLCDPVAVIGVRELDPHEQRLGDEDEEGVLVLHVVVRGAERHPETARELTHGEAVDAVLVDDLERDAEDLGFSEGAPGVGNRRQGRRRRPGPGLGRHRGGVYRSPIDYTGDG